MTTQFVDSITFENFRPKVLWSKIIGLYEAWDGR